MKALICSTRMPEYDRECGSKRVFDLLQFLKQQGWSITFVASQAEAHDRHAAQLRREGVSTYVGLDILSEEFLEAERFDLAVLAFWHVAESCLPRLRRWSPETKVIVDSIDLHFLRNARGVFGRARAADPHALLDGKFGDETARELNAYAAADLVLAVSQKEAGLIGDLIGDADAARWVPLCEDVPRSTVPFAERKGILFVGNFWHQPNVEAVEYLVEAILPQVEPSLLAEHPLWIVGNASEKVKQFDGHPSVRVVGWVPTLLPYLNGARVTTVPLLHGAGTKGKLVQSLMAGTPVVSTRAGIEGLDVVDGRDLVVGDDAEGFAAGIERLLTDESLWHRVADCGHAQLVGIHGSDAVRGRFLDAVGAALDRPCKPAIGIDVALAAETPYERLRRSIKNLVEQTVPVGASVAVISKGDTELIRLEDRRGEHFPQLADGRYAGAYPANGATAVAELERLEARGVDFLVVPSPASWWLSHYKELKTHLDQRGQLVSHDDTCDIFRLPAAKTAAAPVAQPSPMTVAASRPPRPRVETHARCSPIAEGRPRVLALGIYLVGQPNYAVDEAAILSAARTVQVEQRWVALGGDPPPELADITVATLRQKTPKFTILNDLLQAADLAEYEYVMVIDDDVILPNGFADVFFPLQRELDFALAQPARTSDSYLDHPIVEQQRGVLARQTMFVEIGPVFSVHRSIFDLVFPFDLTSAMGWGYENVWAHRVSEHGLKMGIIDAVPVSHSLRKSVVNYSWHTSDAERQAFLAKHRHVDLDDCFRVIDITTLAEARHA